MRTLNCRPLGASIATAILGGTILLAGCSEPEMVSVPTVEGVSLDDAYEVLKDAGFNVTHDDYFEDRAVFNRSNWVVIEQLPAADESASKGSDVQLNVAKIDDEGTAALLPEDSPVMADAQAAAEDRAAEEARVKDQQVSAAQQAETAYQDYIEGIDPTMLRVTQSIGSVNEFADFVRVGIEDSSDFRLAADLIHESMTELVNGLDRVAPPANSGRGPAHDRLKAAAEDFLRAADTLASARGSTKDMSLARYDEIWADATEEWNSAIAYLYDGSGLTPPQVTP